MHSLSQMVAQGYRFGAPSAEAEEIDSQVASGFKCPHCAGHMHYQGWHRSSSGYASYIALAICSRCGYELEF